MQQPPTTSDVRSGTQEVDGVTQSAASMSRPSKVEAPPVNEEEYKEYRQATDLREPYRIPHTYLQLTKKFKVPELAEAPLVVFINSRSGGRAGPQLTEVLYHALGHSQVFDLQETRPGVVLQQIYANFAQAEKAGDPLAATLRKRLRILAAGGDGTVAWILGTIRDLKLEPPPSVAVMPLGTGNDLSLSFGWGNTFLNKWIQDYKTIYATIKRIADAEQRDLDAWHINISAGDAGLFEELPHSLSLAADPEQHASRAEVRGLFWNYFSIGMDATAAYGFHHLRETKPWAAPSRLINQAWYAYYGCASGWFCNARPIRNTVGLKVKKTGGEWMEVKIPASVKAIVLLNLQSYGGGRDLWGLRDAAGTQSRGWQTPIFNDGVFEAMGLRSGWHTALVMGGVSPKVHAMRLAQGNEMVLEVRGGQVASKGDAALAHMQLDGEPWPQAVPSGGGEPLRIHVSIAGTSKMLFNTEKLSGMPRKIKQLAAREATVSLQQQTSMKEQQAQLELAAQGNPDVQVAPDSVTAEAKQHANAEADAAAHKPVSTAVGRDALRAHGIESRGVQDEPAAPAPKPMLASGIANTNTERVTHT